MNNIDEQLESYYIRENYYLEHNNLKKNTSRYKANFIKFRNNRDDQLSKFILDAKLLLNLSYEEDLHIKNPRLRNRCVQYHYLEKHELKAYIGYRTQIRQNIIPQNPQFSFLVIYLMEIINDVYSCDFEYKLQLVKKVETLTKQTKRYRDLFKEAYEILFLQNDNIISLENFRIKYNVPSVFEDYSFDKNIFDDFKFIYETSISEIEANEIDKFLIKDSYKEIITKVIERNLNFNFYGTDRELENALNIFYEKTVFSINKLYSFFPLSKKYSFYNDKGEMLLLENGILEKRIKPNFKKYTVNLFFKILRDTFRNLLRDDINIFEGNPNSSYFYRNHYLEYPEARKMMKDIVNDWILKNEYCINAYNKSIEQLKYDHKKKFFNLDIEDIQAVRNDSAKIQNKIIIEDENEVIRYQNEDIDPKEYFKKIKERHDNDTIINKTDEIEDCDDSKSMYINFIKALDDSEKSVLNFLIMGLIEEAEIVATNNNMMLSLIIEKINIKAVEYIDDIVIEDNEIIEDYRESIMLAF